jgi:hypothetical protein
MSKLTTHTSDITVRLAVPSDSSRLRTLAALDSARLPEGELVVAETGGQIVAALPLSGGAAIADPFHRTAAIVQMLELRAAQLRPRETPAPAPSLAERIRRGMGERPVLRAH